MNIYPRDLKTHTSSVIETLANSVMLPKINYPCELLNETKKGVLQQRDNNGEHHRH